ncbi:unnamed protein product, partial [Microthlaspi erraticum]
MNSISRARVIGALSGPFQRFPSLPCGESSMDIQARDSGHVAL